MRKKSKEKRKNKKRGVEKLARCCKVQSFVFTVDFVTNEMLVWHGKRQRKEEQRQKAEGKAKAKAKEIGHLLCMKSRLKGRENRVQGLFLGIRWDLLF